MDKISRPRRRWRTPIVKLGAPVATLAIAASFAAVALASSAVTIGSASNSKLGENVLVSSQGRTLYTLTPETAHHLLCKSSECLKFWPPLTVPSSSAKVKLAAGVHGHVGILHRSNGKLQVTLNGRPLYRFAADHANGEVNGQNFKSFGGTWRVLSDSGSPSSTEPGAASTPTPTTPPAMPSNPPYGY
jgi:predicted lipoprotein with Yx(FWY)xxD motif